MKKKFKTVDLFAGIGGIRTGFEQAGFLTVYANDFDKYCKKTYDANSDQVKLTVKDIAKKRSMLDKSVLDDIKEIEYDFLLGGFPCQAFSIAGYREGFTDKKNRGELFFEIAKIIKETKPKGFLLENVKNLRGHDNGKTFKIIIDTLEHLGYFVKAQVLNSKDYGNVPQNRERIFIVGFRSKKQLDKFRFPKKVALTKEVVDLLDKKVDEKYYYNGKPLYLKLKDDVKNSKKVYQWRRKYVRENKNGVCPTLTANMGMGGHNVPIIKDKKGIRKLTPRECARLQGFSDSFVLPSLLADSRLYKQIGNSVTVPVVKRVAIQIAKAMN
jgi:DNA (cytosine-5)-methyltransferase 1